MNTPTHISQEENGTVLNGAERCVHRLINAIGDTYLVSLIAFVVIRYNANKVFENEWSNQKMDGKSCVTVPCIYYLLCCLSVIDIVVV